MDDYHYTLYRATQVRALDRIAIEEFGIPGYELMCRAGHAAFQCIATRWPNAQSLRVYCGSGNNGGDGYVIARLGIRAGWRVQVVAIGDPGKLHGDALRAYQDYLEAGDRLEAWPNNSLEAVEVIVDALLGTGLDRAVGGDYATAIDEINKAQCPVVAVDIPSGLNADTGNPLGCAVKACCTVTFIGLKQGLFTGQAADYVGKLVYDALDVPAQIFQRLAANIRLIRPNDHESAASPRQMKVATKPSPEGEGWVRGSSNNQLLPPRSRCAHKGSMGHVLVIGGEEGFSGAARMAGEAALRIGAGLVSIATRKAHASYLNAGRPELMCHAVENGDDLQALLAKADVVILGPGLGRRDWGKCLFAAVEGITKPIVLDADGLNFLAETQLKKDHWILTPHPGEAGRLLHCSTADVQQNRYTAVAALNARYGGIAVLKGAGTLVAGNSRIGVATVGNPGMASGGMGDVLSGVIGGLLAQGLPLQEGAEQGVYCHGRAADLAAQQAGERGLLASDLFPFLRQLVN